MKYTRFFGKILCLILLFHITSCGSGKEEQSHFLTEQEWEYDNLSCMEILSFQKDGRFSYYEACGNPMANWERYETYSYDDDTGIITVHGEGVEDSEIAILRHTEGKLLVSIGGVIKEFHMNSDVPYLFSNMRNKLSGYSAYLAIGDIYDDMIEVAPSDFDVDAGGLESVRKEKLTETAIFYQLHEEVIHSEEEGDKVTTEFTELNREDVARSEDNSFSYGFVWYNDNLEITKIIYYGSVENWE